MPNRSLSILIALIGTLIVASGARGHAVGENYVWLNVEHSHLEGRVEIRLEDLREYLQLDIPEEADAAHAALVENADTVWSYVREHFAIVIDGEELEYELVRVELGEAPRFGHFGQYFYRSVDAEIPDQFTIRNDLLLDEDRFHRSLLCIEFNRKTGEDFGEEFTAMVFSRFNREQLLDLTDIPGLLRIREFVWQGMLHIWIGIDHILFLVALLLPAVLLRQKTAPLDNGTEVDASRRSARWLPVPGFRGAFWNIFKIVTVFTVAHSITLSLAALDILTLPSRFVESTIAVSIIVVGLNNIFPAFRESTLVVIFLFGLFHGLGFASVMGELPFRMQHLVKILLAFNIGVEIGQVAIVVAIFPLIFMLRRSALYTPVVLGLGSIAIILIAAYWFAQRALGLFPS